MVDAQPNVARVARRRTIALVVLWAAVMGGVAFASGCYGHNCDGDFQTWGRNPGEGELVDQDTWESTPIDGDWLPFTRQRLWTFNMRELGDRLPSGPVEAYISGEKNPVQAGTNWTTGSGNLAEQSGAAPGIISVKNDTCADYFIRVVVRAGPRPTATATPAPADAGDGADASTDDAEAGP